MIENAFVEAMHVGESVRGRQIDSRLPLLGTHIRKIVRRNPELHGVLPEWRPIIIGTA
jgi:hypothetical protein